MLDRPWFGPLWPQDFVMRPLPPAPPLNHPLAKQLPIEVIEVIVRVADPSVLALMMRVCSGFNRVAGPVLYPPGGSITIRKSGLRNTPFWPIERVCSVRHNLAVPLYDGPRTVPSRAERIGRVRHITIGEHCFPDDVSMLVLLVPRHNAEGVNYQLYRPHYSVDTVALTFNRPLVALTPFGAAPTLAWPPTAHAPIHALEGRPNTDLSRYEAVLSRSQVRCRVLLMPAMPRPIFFGTCPHTPQSLSWSTLMAVSPEIITFKWDLARSPIPDITQEVDPWQLRAMLDPDRRITVFRCILCTASPDEMYDLDESQTRQLRAALQRFGKLCASLRAAGDQEPVHIEFVNLGALRPAVQIYNSCECTLQNDWTRSHWILSHLLMRDPEAVAAHDSVITFTRRRRIYTCIPMDRYLATSDGWRDEVDPKDVSGWLQAADSADVPVVIPPCSCSG